MKNQERPIIEEKRSFRAFRRVLAVFFCCMYLSGPAQTLVSGEAIKNGSFNGIGDFPSPGISAPPLGVAPVYGGEYPDLFLRSDRWYPGAYLYRWAGFNKYGVPVFTDETEIKIPVSCRNAGTVFTFRKKIYGLWYESGKLISAIYQQDKKQFDAIDSINIKLPGDVGALGIIQIKGDELSLVFSVGDGVEYHADGNYRGEDYFPYDGEGIYRGGLPTSALFQVTVKLPLRQSSDVVLWSPDKKDIKGTHYTIFRIDLGDGKKGIISGSLLGKLTYMEYSEEKGNQFIKKYRVVDTKGNTIRHPGVFTMPIAYPSKNGTYSDLITSCEGGLFYMKYLGVDKTNGNIIYSDPVNLKYKGGELVAGTLVVPSLVDWDKDGDEDIICGNSMGYLLFIENIGDNEHPAFIDPKRIKAGGFKYFMQNGYGGNIQGPYETRWGYLCPNVIDWNHDGLPDLVMNDSKSMHSVFINTGSPTRPQLAPQHALYLDELELRGTWRCKPAAGFMGDKMVYITLDDDDEFHLYFQVDDYNLVEGYKLKLTDGRNIKANFLGAGGTGRIKFNWVDWDLDEVKDLVVGTPRHATIPEPEEGLPYRYEKEGKPGASVLFLKNVGNDTNPVFNYPKLMRFKGAPIYLGQHSCAPAPWYRNAEKGPDLVVGMEKGRLIYYNRDDLSW
ncbi:MAG: VCBS repeat-containing protein [Phaeodactylibacter sp.]|nr:VCBS repeat-containing protein [Phaeodactylibacter sp.]